MSIVSVNRINKNHKQNQNKKLAKLVCVITETAAAVKGEKPDWETTQALTTRDIYQAIAVLLRNSQHGDDRGTAVHESK